MFSVVVILLYRGFARCRPVRPIPDPYTDPNVLLVNGVGGLTIIGLGLTLLEIRRIHNASLLPAPLLVVLPYWATARGWRS